MTAHALTTACAALLLLAGFSVPASAASSAYTDLDLDRCKTLSSNEFGTQWACTGFGGMPLRVAEGDLRFSFAYGRKGEDEVLAGQTLPPFNTLGPRIEWRLDNSGKPFASIVRYLTDRDDPLPDAQVLVVSKLKPGNSCHIAYIDATANADANALARQAADELAQKFDCAKDDVKIIGSFKAWDY